MIIKEEKTLSWAAKRIINKFSETYTLKEKARRERPSGTSDKNLERNLKKKKKKT